MVGRLFRLPRQVIYCALFIMPLMLPALAIAQPPSAVAADNPSGPTAPDSRFDGPGVSSNPILDLDIEQLGKTPVVVPSMDIPVTSVTKQESTVGHSAAAIFVITPEMIRRSGATCIPEALRMAPGMEVSQVNSDTWAISCRGFNGVYASKLLVLIDGRAVYNMDYGGVVWNAQDVLLEDIERIEVIRGPGGTLWGANAVNGVINVITKMAQDTQGAYLMAGGGTHEKTLSGARYGGRIGEDLYYRVYTKYFDRGPDFDPNHQVDDAWRQGRVGFRVDWEVDRDKIDTLTVQGDHYVGNMDNSIIPTNPASPTFTTGENLLMRWRHVCGEDSDWSLQMYYDKFMQGFVSATEIDTTYDVEFQYRFPLGDRHKISCGGGFRNVESYFPGGDAFTTYFPSPYFTTNYTNEYIQDEIAIVEDLLTFTLGCKLEQNPYTGLEYQPSARLLWSIDHRHSAWGAVSRAVRTPNRGDEQITITTSPLAPDVYPRLIGNTDLVSEDLIAYEIGYRTQATDKFSWDIAMYYNVYNHLMIADQGTPFGELNPPPPHLVIPLIRANGASGQTYGIELAANYDVTERWRLFGQYTLLQVRTSDPLGFNEGGDPHNQVRLQSSWNFKENLDFDLSARYVDSLTAYDIPSYISMDARLAWRPRKNWELAVVGQNLLQPYHWEFFGNMPASPAYATEVPRGVYGTATWRY